MAVEFTSEQRSRRAADLLQDPLFNEAIKAVHDAYVAAFRSCRGDDDRGRRRYSDALNDLDAVKAHLLAVVAQGELDAKRAQELQTPTLTQKVTRIF
jgi:FixJ family two-component response regulator